MEATPDEVTQPPTAAEMLRRVEAGWRELNELLGSLSAEQLTGPRDAHGWSVREHLIHISAWEHSLLALLNGQDRAAAVGVDPAADHSDIDKLNDLIVEAHRGKTLEQVQAHFQQSHAQLLARLRELDDAGILRPYAHYQPEPDAPQEPVINWIAGNTWGHYEEHIPWIKAILDEGKR
jgi:hypothetical protein